MTVEGGLAPIRSYADHSTARDARQHRRVRRPTRPVPPHQSRLRIIQCGVMPRVAFQIPHGRGPGASRGGTVRPRSPLANDDYHKTSRTSPVSRPTWRDCPRGQPVVVVGGAGTPAGKPCASGNRVPCTAADRPLERRVLGHAGPIWNDRCPRVYHDRDAGRPSGPLTREICLRAASST